MRGLGTALSLWVMVSGPPPRETFEPHEWREAALRSSCVVAGVVVDPWVYIVRPERRTETIVVGPDGSRRMETPRLDEYVEGGVSRIKLDAVYRADGNVSPDQTIEIFTGDLGPPDVRQDHRYLFFLRQPIDDYGTGMPGGLRHSSSLRGTVYQSRRLQEEPFDPAEAYGFSATGVPAALEFTEQNDDQIAAAVSQATLDDRDEHPWAQCASTADWTCTAEGPGGCSRPGSRSRLVPIDETDPSSAIDAESDPPSGHETCTEWAAGYVATFSTGAWSDCSAPCGGGGRIRLVTATSWRTEGPDAVIPANRELCNTHACEQR